MHGEFKFQNLKCMYGDSTSTSTNLPQNFHESSTNLQLELQLQLEDSYCVYAWGVQKCENRINTEFETSNSGICAHKLENIFYS